MLSRKRTAELTFFPRATALRAKVARPTGFAKPQADNKPLGAILTPVCLFAVLYSLFC